MKEKLIGLYQLITGIFGAILLAFSIPKAIKVPEMLPLYLLGLALFVGVAYAGYALLNKLKHAVTISIWAQALQILGFSYSGVQYLFTGSAFLSLAYKGGFHIESQIAPIAYSISRISSMAPLEIKLFVIPLLFVWLLAKK